MKKLTLITLLLVLFFSACNKEVLDMEKFSTDVELTHQGAFPLIKGAFHIDDFFGEDDSELLVIDGDTVKLIYETDTTLEIDLSEFGDIPSIPSKEYNISPEIDFQVGLIGSDTTLRLDTLLIEEPFSYSFPDTLRFDMVYLNEGYLNIDVVNEFDLDIILEITSEDVFNDDGTSFIETVEVSANNYSFSQSVPLNDKAINLSRKSGDTAALSFVIIPTVIIDDPSAMIYAEDSISIVLSFSDLNDFEVVFGYFGGYTDNTSFTLSFEDLNALDNLKGFFNVTDPRININFEDNVGAPIALRLDLFTYRDGEEELIDFGEKIIEAEEYDADDPLNTGTITFEDEWTDKINQLLTFPLPDSIKFNAQIKMNPYGDINTDTNYAVIANKLDFDIDVEIPLEFAADLYYDTLLSLKDLNLDFDDIGIEYIEYIRLHHWIKNGFPFGMGITFELYDSINDYTYPTPLYFADKSDSLLLKPAPVNEKGEVDTSQLEYEYDTIIIEGETAEFLIDNATHVRMYAKFQTTDIEDITAVNVYYYYSMDFHLGLEYKLTYIYKEEEQDEE